MGEEIITKPKPPQYIFCYWDDVIFLSEDKIKEKKK
tara:strand:+ start:14 stop:121 length:108 start_codon:yes stop_codon:yes gene_type:complete